MERIELSWEREVAYLEESMDEQMRAAVRLEKRVRAQGKYSYMGESQAIACRYDTPYPWSGNNRQRRYARSRENGSCRESSHTAHRPIECALDWTKRSAGDGDLTHMPRQLLRYMKRLA